MTLEQVMISNKLGLHARAAAKLVHTASAFESEIYVGTEHEEVNAKSILGILTLAATKGTPLNVRADGSDEAEAVQAIVQLFADKFGDRHVAASCGILKCVTLVIGEPHLQSIISPAVIWKFRSGHRHSYLRRFAIGCLPAAN